MSVRTLLGLLRNLGSVAKGLTAAKSVGGLLAVLLAVGGIAAAANNSNGSGNSSASNGKADIALQSAPTSQTVTRGQSVAYTVTVSSVNSFSGTVALTVTGLPSGATAAFSPASVTLAVNGTANSTLTVTTTSSTATGAANLTVTGTSGKVSQALALGLTVNQAAGSVAVSATPATVTLAPGAIAVYTLTLTRTNYAGAVTFAAAGLPAGATATFSPNPAGGSSASLQIATSDTMKDGSYPVTISASGSGIPTAGAGVQFVLQTTGKAFAIAGSVAGLSPGVSVPVNLSLTNQNKKQISVTNLTVTIDSVTRTAAAVAAGRPCGLADYAVQQYSGPYPLT
ncbi:MAG: hypothetical protein JO144_15105, partial [Actinobacteria bacterium]|nr:hypothetical protein [Actinomycetota bacterium]